MIKLDESFTGSITPPALAIFCDTNAKLLTRDLFAAANLFVYVSTPTYLSWVQQQARITSRLMRINDDDNVCTVPIIFTDVHNRSYSRLLFFLGLFLLPSKQEDLRQTSRASIQPRACSWVVRIEPLRFLAGCRKRQLNQAPFVLSLSIFLSVLFIRVTAYVALVHVCMCCISWLFWLSCQYWLNE